MTVATGPAIATGVALTTRTSPRVGRRLHRVFFRNALVTAGTVALALVLGIAVLGPVMSPYDPLKSNLRHRIQPPSMAHIAGTDAFGRDVFTRIAYGARISLVLSLVIVVLTTVVASVIGVTAAWFRRLDNPVMRLMDVMMSVPSLILAIALMGFLGARQDNLVIAIVVTQVPRMTRLVRSAVLSVRANEFVELARALGCTNARIMVRHIYPHCVSPIVVQATFLFAQAILIEAALSFVGVGTPPPTPSWGNMLAEGREHISIAWWLTVLPGISIMVVVLGLNLLGDGLRDLLDPRLRGQD
ncbi:MAG: ABC transporter permease [Candidatus Rokubacteria bacterium]|nr:ABC transporter permease [Candidatus Rokubacteria bacterium]